MTRFTGYSAPASGNAWWIGCWGLLLAATVVRLLLDMRACRIALVTIALALAAWSAGLAVQLSGASLRSIPTALVAETLKLSGHLLLLLGVTLYARHVILHAQGLLPSRNPKRRKERAKEKAKAAASSNSSLTRVDQAHNPLGAGDKRSDQTAHSGTTATPHSHLASQSSDSDDDSDYDDDDDSNDRNRKLTKAERKRLRKHKSEERGW